MPTNINRAISLFTISSRRNDHHHVDYSDIKCIKTGHTFRSVRFNRFQSLSPLHNAWQSIVTNRLTEPPHSSQPAGLIVTFRLSVIKCVNNFAMYHSVRLTGSCLYCPFATCQTNIVKQLAVPPFHPSLPDSSSFRDYPVMNPSK
ncbi:hypothetical protein AVEN_169554-1 [Araneus ventricosus]|uniref:Uncharacterized protein n=1 Tax=Araneus ventricosus TaxID=182803 RepID=A0A4Y2TUF6_ARAVE|nr:hypothetical protein AVEN_169554-1 [Araneus ventricosus]